MRKRNGVFTISLDFELYWGVRDKKTIGSYAENLLGVRHVVPCLLRVFERYHIHASWATVGLLFFENRNEMIERLPVTKPTYNNMDLSPYSHISHIGLNEKEDPFHFASSLIKMIAAHPSQEIGSHTFSHYYCLERGQDITEFRADLQAAIQVAQKYNLKLESFVFPRNQVNRDYLSTMAELGIKTYRGNEAFWIYCAQSGEDGSIVRRGLRLLDTYIDISSHNSTSFEQLRSVYPYNIPSSRFLRPYSRWLSILEPLRLRRILSGLTYAAQKGNVYHLWWHPHNFGTHLDENIRFLEQILDHYSKLREDYGMESLNMTEIANRILAKEV